MTRANPRLIWAAVLLIVLPALAYSNTLTAPFIFDDTPNITENASIRQLWPPLHFLSIPPDTGLVGRPVVNFSLAVNYSISKGEVWSYHVLNLIIHILASLTLFGVLRRVLATPINSDELWDDVLPLSFACALLWALHPLQTQAVTYVIQRCESLMALFLLLTFYSVLRGWQSTASRPWHLLAVFFFLLAVGSKEVAVVAPFLLILYEWVFTGIKPLQAIRRSPLLYTGLVLGIFMAISLSLSGNTLMTRTEGIAFTLPDYWITQCQIILHYLRLALWPSGLTIDYGWPVAALAAAWPSVTGILIIAGLSAWAIGRRARAGFLGAWFLLILAPTSLIPLPDLAFEHRMYLPLAAVIVLAAGLTFNTSRRAMMRFRPQSTSGGLFPLALPLVILSLLSLYCGFLTYQRNHDYRSAISIWSDTIKKRPANFRGYHGLGLALSREGQLDEGLAYMYQALRRNPRNAYVCNDTGFILFLLDRPEEAIPFFRKALGIKPNLAKAHNNMSAALAQTGRLEEGISHFFRSPEDQAGL